MKHLAQGIGGELAWQWHAWHACQVPSRCTGCDVLGRLGCYPHLRYKASLRSSPKRLNAIEAFTGHFVKTSRLQNFKSSKTCNPATWWTPTVARLSMQPFLHKRLANAKGCTWCQKGKTFSPGAFSPSAFGHCVDPGELKKAVSRQPSQPSQPSGWQRGHRANEI